MDTLRTIQTVSGPSLTIAVPVEFAGRQVEVTIVPMEGAQPLPPEVDPRYAPFILPKPALTDEQRTELANNPFPLRATGSELIDPFAPAVPPEDWEVNRDDPA